MREIDRQEQTKLLKHLQCIFLAHCISVLVKFYMLAIDVSKCQSRCQSLLGGQEPTLVLRNSSLGVADYLIANTELHCWTAGQ